MLKLGRLVSLLGATVLLPLPASTISAQDTGACAYEEPAWSPDGNRLLFSSTRDGNFEIYSVRRSGRDLQRLTNHPASEPVAAWSPDGRLIVFVSNRDGASTLYLMNGRGNRAGRPGLYLMSWDGSKLVLVIQGCADPAGCEHGGPVPTQSWEWNR